MHFVSAQSEEDQISDIVNFLQDHMRDSVEPHQAAGLENFEDKLNDLLEQSDYSGIIDYLLSLKSIILQLPISHKKSAITIQRIVLLILPLLKALEDQIYKDKKKYEELKKRVLLFCGIIEESTYPLSIKVNSVLHIFSIFDEKSALKGVVFQRLFELCEKNEQLSIIVENLKNLEEVSKEWQMSLDEKKQLYKSCANTLDRNNESVAAFRVMAAYLKMFEKSKEAELSAVNIENEARRCIILAVKVPTVIDFHDILNLNAVKYLQGKNKDVFDFMSLFTSTNSKEFEQKVKTFQKLIETEKITLEEVIKKKQYIQICSLKLENSNHKYADLANILNIKIDDVEPWAIEAIASGIIDAKIDQLKEEVVIKSHIMNQELNSIKEKLRDWKLRFIQMQSILQASQGKQ